MKLTFHQISIICLGFFPKPRRHVIHRNLTALSCRGFAISPFAKLLGLTGGRQSFGTTYPFRFLTRLQSFGTLALMVLHCRMHGSKCAFHSSTSRWMPRGKNKQDGGKRPLAIASLAWRVGMAAIIQTLRPWIKWWSPPELSGGVPNKGIHNIHAELFQDRENCQHQRQRFAGCEADVKTCFDSVQPNLAIAIWRRLGAPVSVLHVLTSFYSSQNRWFAVRI